MRKLLNNGVAIFLVFVIVILIVPLPTAVLDFMFMFNITLSFVILLMTMYIKETLDLSIFPSLMLITTLLRLSLNVSSTRLILTEGGSAGKVIETFGNFVIQGDPVVGFVIFFIIVFVNFFVINKGSERVAEVSARFTLDAMPGKQMAIDADLNSGLIDEQQAKERRAKIQREADFYGAMDGATKFVKGDAIASIVITLINFIGGVIIGMVSGGMDFATVLTTYTIATIGDGLVSQVPSLLIAVATGLIVTRSSSEDNLIGDIARQMLGYPVALAIGGTAVLAMALIPGSPKAQIFLISGTLYVLAFILNRTRREAALVAEGGGAGIDLEEPMPEMLNEAEYYKNIDNVYTLLGVDPITMEFGYSLIPHVDESSGGSFIDRIVMFRKQFASEYGVVVPTVRMVDNGLLNPNQYVIKIKGEEVGRGEVLVDYYLALDPGNVIDEIDGIDTVEPAYGIPSKWITEDLRETAEVYGYTVIDPLSVIVTHMSEIVKRHIHEVLTRQDIMALLENVSRQNKAIVDDVVPGLVSVGDLQKILSNLLREGVPVKDMESILETLSDYAPSVKDTDLLTEYCRQKLRRTITRQYVMGNVIKVVTVDQEIEQAIMNSLKKGEHGTYMAMEPDKVQRIVGSLIDDINAIKDIVPVPIVLTSPIVRIYLKKMLDQFNPNIVVLSFSEIDPTVQIQALANVQI
ncbi:flagellar biosynthesis protein FlhA [Ruminococcaceae bacterium OttesenSCG-928-L11]|nr:flagellar biosynthesis protein FlhA [Ruminococcaceae bacterium OttesenSCG-928-L11]